MESTPPIDTSKINSAKPSDLYFAESADWLRICHTQQNFFHHKFYFLMRHNADGYRADSLRSLRAYNKNDIHLSSTPAESSPQKKPKTPCVTAHLKRAIEWQRLLDTGRFNSRSSIARQEGLSRARVTQILSLINLAPKIRQYIISLPKTTYETVITERTLRSLTRIKDKEQQIETFERISGVLVSR